MNCGIDPLQWLRGHDVLQFSEWGAIWGTREPKVGGKGAILILFLDHGRFLGAIWVFCVEICGKTVAQNPILGQKQPILTAMDNPEITTLIPMADYLAELERRPSVIRRIYPSPEGGAFSHFFRGSRDPWRQGSVFAAWKVFQADRRRDLTAHCR
jgi:hypothetical protein